MPVALWRTLVWVLCGLVVTACMTRPGQSELTSCTYPDSPRTPAPGFICGQPLSGYPLTQLMSSPPGNSSAAARIETGRRAVQNQWVLEWTQAWYADLSGVQRDRAQALLYDWLGKELRVVRTRTSPAGTIWILVGLNRTAEQAREVFNKRLRSAGITPPQLSTEQELP